MDDPTPETRPSPKDVIVEFLDRIEDPDRREDAIELFADDAVVTRPGVRHEGRSGIEEYLAGGTDGYEWVEKNRDRWIETEEYAVSIGTLYGVNADGEPFEDVRYVDICRVQDGEIVRLDIYNDSYPDGVL